MVYFVDAILIFHVLTEAFAFVFILLQLDPSVPQHYLECSEKAASLITLFAVQAVGITLVLGVLALLSKRPRSKIAIYGISYYHFALSLCYLPALLEGKQMYGLADPKVTIGFHLPMGFLMMLPALGVVANPDELDDKKTR
uniref:Uncharacterized protein n=1 Tax=Aplanochytrium stocchinoi TaxID=215587 RepID=A0A7S3PNW6_9STRA|mmetsp:Transcript_13165/g.15194  ORF Transcript_13165/g.15194 Transcript_13165/m.15194 type:complete len:141 (+) Transcript_13165:812-1234(+)